MNRLKIPNNSITRHLLIAITAILITFVFWIAHYEWDEEMRLWRALGDSGYLLLFVTLILGPLGKLWPRLNHLLSWRRETGIWFAILAITHGLLIANGWANWDVARFFGYEFVPQLGRIARMEPGFGYGKLDGFCSDILDCNSCIYFFRQSDEMVGRIILEMATYGFKRCVLSCYNSYCIFSFYALY